MNTDADNALIASLKAVTASGGVIDPNLAERACARLQELLEHKRDLFQQLIEQLDHIDDLEERIRNNS